MTGRPRGRRGKRCNARRTARVRKRTDTKRSPESPGGSPVGAPLQTQPSQEARQLDGSKGWARRLPQFAQVTLTVATRAVQVGHLVPEHLRDRLVNLLGMH
jgi:hypothetical protein